MLYEFYSYSIWPWGWGFVGDFNHIFYVIFCETYVTWACLFVFQDRSYFFLHFFSKGFVMIVAYCLIDVMLL